MSDQRIKNLIIVGGGTAGWMAAALFSRVFHGQPFDITLVESEEIATVGVGEATVPVIRNFNKVLGIDEQEFIRETQGSFKLSIEFNDWGYIGNRFFHGFGDFGSPIQGIAPHHHWLKLSRQYALGSLEEWSFATVASRAGKFLQPPQDANLQSIAAYKYAYHFDASLYARYLRGYAETRGVKRLNDQVENVILNADNGHIAQLQLRSGTTLAADFYIDCSGFRGVLINQALNVPYDHWNHWLPCDRAVAVACELKKELTPFTSSTACEAGWQWRIPLQHRVGNGYVYSSHYIDDENARENFCNRLEGEMVSSLLNIKFAPGRRVRSWEKNCVAIGLASGFLEPLESTSIQLIQTALLRILDFFPDKNFNQDVINEYNRISKNEYERVRDFIILHYRFGSREEKIWQDCRHQEIPETLKYKIDVYRASGRVPMLSEESYAEFSWVSIFNGLGVLPERYDPLVDLLDESHLVKGMERRRADIIKLVDKMPGHAHFIKEFCAKPAV